MISIAVCVSEETGEVLQSWWSDSKKEIDDSQIPDDVPGKHRTLLYLEDLPEPVLEEMDAEFKEVDETVKEQGRTVTRKVFVNKNHGKMKPVQCSPRPAAKSHKHECIYVKKEEGLDELTEMVNCPKFYHYTNGKIERKQKKDPAPRRVLPPGYVDDGD